MNTKINNKDRLKPKFPCLGDTRGFALISTMLLGIFMSLAAAVFLSKPVSETGLGEDQAEYMQAMYAAETGVERARLRLKDWAEWASWPGRNNGGSVYPNNSAMQFTSLDIDGDPATTADNATTDVWFTWHPGPTEGDLFVRGSFGGKERSLQLRVDKTIEPVFGKALCACEGDVNVHGNQKMIDSYDSRLGCADPSDPTCSSSYGGSNIAHNGNVASNGNVNINDYVIYGSVEAKGDIYGVSGGMIDKNTYVGGTLDGIITVNGDIYTNYNFIEDPCPCGIDMVARINDVINSGDNDNNTIDCDPFTAGRQTNCLTGANGTDFELKGGGSSEVWLRSGTYYFTEFDIRGNRKILVDDNQDGVPGDGEVIIYLDHPSFGNGKLNGGAVVNTTNNASNLRIYIHSSSPDSFTLQGNADLSASIYAPNYDVGITGNGAMYGAMVANDIDVGGSGDVHYDADLARKIGPEAQDNEAHMVVISWEEL